jgi:YfiH family protein
LKTVKLGAETVQTERGGVVTLTFPRLADPKVLKHAVSTRLGGVSQGAYRSLNLSLKAGDESVCVQENRDLLSQAVGMNLRQAAYVDQVHGDRILRFDKSQPSKPGESLGEGDGVITNEPFSPLVILVADCLPVLFYDPVHRAIGLAHAGWRGTVSHVAAKALLSMGEAYGTKPEETRAVLGPAIGPCCYEVGEEVRKEFSSVFPWGNEVFERTFGNRWKLNLPEANTRQLLEIGMKEENLIRSEICTVEHLELFYSHRAEAFSDRSTGRVGALMMLMD